MKKIFLVLLLPVLVFAVGTYDTCITSGKWSTDANWSATVKPTADDTVIMKTGINDTADYDFKVIKVIIPAVSGTHWYTGRADTVVDTFSNDGTGTYHLGNSMAITGARGLFHIGSGVGVGTVTQFNQIMNTSTGGVIDIDKASLTFASLSISGVVTNSGAQQSIYSSALPLTLANNSTWTINKRTDYKLTSTGNFHSIGTGCTINGTASEVKWLIAANGITGSFPAYTYSGSGVNYFLDVGFTGWTLQFTGDQSMAGAVLTIQASGTSVGTIDINDVKFNSTGVLYAGNGDATRTLTINFGTDSVLCTWFDGSSAVGFGYGTLNLESVTLICTRSCIFGANQTINPSTSKIVMNSAALCSLKTQNKLYYDVLKTGSSKCVTIGNLLGNDLTVSAGPWTMGASDSLRDITLSSNTATDTIRLPTTLLKCGRNLSASGTARRVDTAMVEFCGAQNHNVTGGTTKFNKHRLVGGSLTLLARYMGKWLFDSSGTVITNGNTLLVDDSLTIGDSIYTAAADSLIDSGNVRIQSDAKPNLLGRIFMVGNAWKKIFGSNKSLGRVVVQKGETGGVELSGTTLFDTLTFLSGQVIDTTAADTVKADVAFVSDSVSHHDIRVPIRSRYFYLAANSNMFWGSNGKIINKDDDSMTVVSNGNALPIIHNTYRASIQ